MGRLLLIFLLSFQVHGASCIKRLKHYVQSTKLASTAHSDDTVVLAKRVVENYEKLYARSFEEVKKQLKTIDAKAFKLTEKIVHPDNLIISMRRHHTPIEIKEDGDGVFHNDITKRHPIPEMVIRPYKDYFQSFYQTLTAQEKRDYSYTHLTGKSAFLEFKKVPNKITVDQYYDGEARFFGSHIYHFPYNVMKDRALYFNGDAGAVLAEAANYYPETFIKVGEYETEASPLRTSDNEFIAHPLSNLSEVFIHVFQSLRETNYKRISWPGGAAYRPGQPGGDGFEVHIMGKLTLEDISKEGDSGEAGMVPDYFKASPGQFERINERARNRR